ncbi:phosphotransferase [Acidipropionibacterium timonense]|uniref:phosphotransferase n=1 Tax=Acidipropionibacterium timonense TaxID=2161818 RepID=UPI0010312D09|nr:phosphotransferase [Acidipropionibacterium timonense]
MTADPDGSVLLTTSAVGGLLEAAIDHAGGRLASWRISHVDANPGQSTTATYRARVDWPYGQRTELLGVSARVAGPATADAAAQIFADGDRRVAVWLYPDDPDLPALPTATYPDRLAEFLTRIDAVGRPLGPSGLTVSMIGYRPRRRAVLRVQVRRPRVAFYIKVVRPRALDDIVERHLLLARAGLPVPDVAGSRPDGLVVLSERPGVPLSEAVFDPEPPCTADDLIDLLDAMPAQVADLPRRAPWSASVSHYASIVASTLPDEGDRLTGLAGAIEAGLDGIDSGREPTHGDFHEGQLHVGHGRIVGLLDIDTVGPGRRADDLACLVAHLSSVQHMDPSQAARVHSLLAQWVPVFDERVDPVELRLRAAAVLISLATGPYRCQDPDWQESTRHLIDGAQALVDQVR